MQLNPETSETREVNELISYFTKSPEPILSTKICAIYKNYDKPNRDKISAWLIENHERRFGIDIPAVYRAINESGAVRNRSEYVDALDVTCEACGISYKWVQQSSEKLRSEKGIHDYCPKCGLAYSDTISAKKYSDLGQSVEWYSSLIRNCQRLHCQPETKWRYEKKLDDEATAEQMREMGARKLQIIESLA